MPRAGRSRSSFDLYHVMIRGINQVQLFYDDADRREFLRRLWKFRDLSAISVLSWCLMGNHIHMLIQAELPELSRFMKRFQLSYSHYYNERYDRQGYLFQDRYKSVPVENDAQLYNVVRYVHRNPLEADLSVRDWTSYDDIATSSGKTDYDKLLILLDSNTEQAHKTFTNIVLGNEPEGEHADIELVRSRMSDRNAMDIILEVTGSETCQDICTFEQGRRNNAVAELRRRGLSVRQISRLTGLSRGIVQSVRP